MSSDCLNTKDTPSQSSRSGFALRFTGPVLLAFVEERRSFPILSLSSQVPQSRAAEVMHLSPSVNRK
ncbi:unnamed protein product [Arctogadus glacialis]